MKRYILERFKFHGLFIKMFVIMVVSITAVSALISWTTIRISEQVYVETFSITNAKVISQIKSGFETMNSAVVNASNLILQNGAVKQYLTTRDRDSLQLSKTYYSMSQQMDQIVSSLSSYELSTIVTGINGRTYATNRTIWPIDDATLMEHRMAKAAWQEPRKMLYQFDPEVVTEQGGTASALVITKALLERTTGTIYGTMFFAIRESELRKFYANYTNNGNDVLIVNREGVIISSNLEPLIGMEAGELWQYAEELIAQGEPNYLHIDFMGREKLLLAEYLPIYDMHIVNLIDMETVLGQLFDMGSVVLIVIGIVAAALIIIFLISRKLTKSLTRLVKQIANISKFDFGHYVAVSGSYETRQLAQAFNLMLDELHAYVDQLVETQKKQRNAELEALQRQINPHFLYNTLASIKLMVQQGSKEKAAETINALISLMQNVIGNVDETVTIRQEIEQLKNYVFINQARSGDRIKVSYFVAPDCEEALLPKLILQPFIENAFFHAFNLKQDGYIYVMVSREGGSLICEVADNGDGMTLESEGKLPKSKGKRQLLSGIGVRNVHDRLTLLYGEPYGVKITSAPGEGTRVRIRLPYQTSKNHPKIQKYS